MTEVEKLLNYLITNYPLIQLEHFWEGIGVYPEGVVFPYENGRPPAQRAARTLLDASAAAYAGTVGDVLAPPGVFPYFDANRAVVAANAALNAAAGIGRYLVKAIRRRSVGDLVGFGLE
jgi:hypothetical protein